MKKRKRSANNEEAPTNWISLYFYRLSEAFSKEVSKFQQDLFKSSRNDLPAQPFLSSSRVFKNIRKYGNSAMEMFTKQKRKVQPPHKKGQPPIRNTME